MNIVSRVYLVLKSLFYWKLRFADFGIKSIIKSPLQLDGAKRIHIGNSVYIGHQTWLAANPMTHCDDCKLVIEHGSTIGHFNHIYATGTIIIENNVLTADKVYISDNLHGYEDVNTPIKQQPIIQKSKVIIGSGSWIGENVCVICSSIGKNCVVGANSVVTHDIPDYCVAVGIPARIIKRYNFNSQKWEKTDKDGNFIK